ncbi:MAG: response regulator [bacterium]|nr:response regulator [bacterium]
MGIAGIPQFILSILVISLLGGCLVLFRLWRKAKAKIRQLQETEQFQKTQLIQAQRYEAVGIMAGSIVHNLNNLMSVILGHTRMVVHALPKQSEVQPELEQVVKASHMACDFLNEISDFNRQAEQAHKPIDLVNTVRSTLKFLKDILPSSIQLVENIPPRCEPVMASTTGVQQVLMNLINNSVQAIDKSQGLIEVSLSTSSIEQWHKANPQDLSPGKYLKLTVRDNGKGMNKETLAVIAGSPADSTPDTTVLGLGLNTILRILKEHHGVIIPSSKLGQGTSFDVYFPKIAWQVVGSSENEEVSDVSRLTENGIPTLQLAKPIATPGNQASEPPFSGQEKGTILLVDDDEMVARVTTLGLQRLGYRVIKHLDSRKALVDYVQTPEIFDVVITDQIMPHMSGVRLARKIHEVSPNIPVILMTGFRDSFNEQKALEAGISQIILKPTSSRDLASIVEKVRLRKQEGQF